jgi:hypothetical protein
MCHSNPTFPASDRARGDILGEIYDSPGRTWMAWRGQYHDRSDRERNGLPGPRQRGAATPGTTWRAVPRDGVWHECRSGGHRLVLTEAELWEVVGSLPPEATVLYLSARQDEVEERSATG